MREIRYSGGLRMLESIVRTPAKRRVLRIEVHGAWTGAERGASGDVMDYANAWPLQAERVLMNLKNATACTEAAANFAGRVRDDLQPLGGDAVVSEAGGSVIGELAGTEAAFAADDAAALVRFDRAASASPDSETALLPPGEGWFRSVATPTCEFREAIVVTPEGRLVLCVAPSGNCAGSDWIAGRSAREHLESLAGLTNFVLLDLAGAPTWSDAATAAAWVLRTRLKSKAGDCLLAGTHAAIRRALIPFQWNISPDVAQALERIDKGE
ncbi:MAG: hypothetical protein FD180_3989 [Planctomycetota bacterium]|nr:MAG: hypothetical protein FD180_3989 [Planctomycetota bacterium]